MGMGDQQTGTPRESVPQNDLRAVAKQMCATMSDSRDEEFATSDG